jgi:hypothetical protein
LGSGLAGGRRAAAWVGFFGLLPPNASSRFTFCPAAIVRASALVFSSVLVLNRRMPCQSFPSANRGSIHTLRLRIALRYGSVSMYALTRSMHSSPGPRLRDRPFLLVVHRGLRAQAAQIEPLAR